jgi:hypothetical protein
MHTAEAFYREGLTRVVKGRSEPTILRNVKGRSKPVTMGALKTSHFEERMACRRVLLKVIMFDFIEVRYAKPVISDNYSYRRAD